MVFVYVGHLPGIPVESEGFAWNPLLNMFHNPGGHCYREGAIPNVYVNLKGTRLTGHRNFMA